MYGQELKGIRRRLRMTQTEMAHRLGVSRAILAKWESDSGELPIRTELAVRALQERLFLEQASPEYIELLEELKRRYETNQLSRGTVMRLLSELGRHQHQCEMCQVVITCFCSDTLSGPPYCEKCQAMMEAEGYLENVSMPG